MSNSHISPMRRVLLLGILAAAPIPLWANALSATRVFPDLTIQMIQVGEQSAELEAMLDKMADVFENEAESSIMSLTSLLAPVLILIMGVIVGFIVLSICLPIFEMSQLIR